MGDKKTPDFVIDNKSSYYFHPSDALGAIITVIRFDGKNYELWEKPVTTGLTEKNKMAFINGTITKPNMNKGASPAEMNAWVIVNSMITSWILNVIDPNLHASTAYADSAQAIWENIKKRYSVPNVPKIHQLKAEIASCKQGNLEVVEFFTKLIGLWNELGDYVKYLKCTCDAAEKYAKMDEEDKVHQILMGLDNDAHSNVRSQILALDPLPPLDKSIAWFNKKRTIRRLCKVESTGTRTHPPLLYRITQREPTVQWRENELQAL